MPQRLLLLIALSLLALAANSVGLRSHTYSPGVSSMVSQAIRSKLLESLNYISNPDIQQKLKQDLNEDDDKKRALREIDVTSARQIFTIMKIPDPGCDADKDGFIKQNELKCLNIIWKTYVPANELP